MSPGPGPLVNRAVSVTQIGLRRSSMGRPLYCRAQQACRRVCASSAVRPNRAGGAPGSQFLTDSTKSYIRTHPLMRFLMNLLRSFMFFLGGVVATLAADWIAASDPFRGGCASSRLDHGFPQIQKMQIFGIPMSRAGIWMLAHAFCCRGGHGGSCDRCWPDGSWLGSCALLQISCC